jgi:hypothetical protein
MKNVEATASAFFNGRVGAINLEQLDLLLESLKTYWDYTNNSALFTELRAADGRSVQEDYQLAYEL